MRHGNDTAAPTGQLQQRGGIQFFRHGQVKADTSAGAQPSSAVDKVGHLVPSPQPLLPSDCPATGAQFAPQCRAISRCRKNFWFQCPPASSKRGATRRCRCEPLLSNRSNRWGRQAAGKAFRSGRTCTARRMARPWVFN